MTERLPVPPAPGPVEDYLAKFDDLFASRAQRAAFRDYTIALLQPRDRDKTLTALAGAEPVVGAQHREVQRLQWFLSESPWDHEPVNDRRVALLVAEPRTAPHGAGALLLDDSGDRKSGHATAYASRQYIGSRGTTENGIVAVSTAWADERLYYPLHTLPYQPAPTLPLGQKDPEFRTKGQLASVLAGRATDAGIAFRALVADAFYGPSESPRFIADLEAADIAYVVALKPNTEIALGNARTSTPSQAVHHEPFTSRRTGHWHRVTRRYRDGHTETWWTLELALGPYGPDQARRMVVATSDPATLPRTSTWYLATNLPRHQRNGGHPPADHTELVRLYGLRNWIEQDYKQVKTELGWADFQVRTGRAIQRHWALVNLAFSFCLHQSNDTDPGTPTPNRRSSPDEPYLSWPQQLRHVRGYLTPLRDLYRLARAGAVSLLTPEIAQLGARLATGTAINLYLPP